MSVPPVLPCPEPLVVANIRDHAGVERLKALGYRLVYVGRRMRFGVGGLETMYALGNPFKAPPLQRETAVQQYALWLEDQVQVEPDGAVARALQELLGMLQRGELLALVCWCAPAACHADAVKLWLERHCSGRVMA